MEKITLWTAQATPAGASAAGAAEPARPLSIALVSDTHTTRGTAEDEPLYRGRLERVMAAVNAANVDLALIAGDLTDGGKPLEIADFQTQIQGLRAPAWVVPGNHDVGDKHIPGKPGGVTAERVARYEQAFGPSFWAWTFDGVRIIGVNSPLLGSGLPREADEWAFLSAELSAPDPLPTLLLSHYPLFLKTEDEPGDPYWNIEPEPRARLLALLRQGGVRAVLSAHLHRSLTAQEGGILFYTTPPVSFGLPRGKQAEGWTLVTVAPGGEIAAEFRPVADPPPGRLPERPPR